MNETPVLPPGIPPLDTIYFYLTQGCNLGCKHCWLNPPIENGPLKYPFLDTGDFIRVVSEAGPLGLRSVKLTGGEPLLHPDISAILDHISAGDLSLTLETNATLITDAIAEKLAAIRNCNVSVSIDSIQAETHDAIRNRPGCFDKTVHNIRKLARHRIPFQIIASLLPENRHEIIDILHFAETLGAGSFKLNVVQPTQRGEQLMIQGKTVAIDDVLDIANTLFQKHCSGTGISVNVTIPFAFRPLHLLWEGDVSRCGIRTIIGVLATGHYALCGIGTAVQELVFGKIGEDSLESIWFSHPVLDRIRKGLPDDLTGICGNCIMKQICLGSCIAQNYYESHNLMAPFWFCRVADNKGLFPESRKINRRG